MFFKAPAHPNLFTERLIIRAPSFLDVDDVFDFCNDPDSCRYADWTPHKNKSETREYLAWLKRKSGDKNFTWVIEHRNDKKVVGTISIVEVDYSGKIVTVGYTLSKEYQHKGIGRQLLDFSEKIIAENYTEIYLHSSLPAKNTYLKRGYVAIESHQIVAENGDVLCYDLMMKNSNYGNSKINYDGKKFISKKNTENGEVSEETIFCYHQKEDIIWAEYSGGEIVQGFLVGTVDSNGNLEFVYQHINELHQLRLGRCNSCPQFMEDGKLEIHEEWQWLSGDQSKGTSIIVEI